MNVQLTEDAILVKRIGGQGWNNAHARVPTHTLDMESVGIVRAVGPGTATHIGPDGMRVPCRIEVEIGETVIYRSTHHHLAVDGDILDLVDSHAIVAVVA